jgi:alkylation response protein AidB-like acyl-CoA dehydrogenase
MIRPTAVLLVVVFGFVLGASAQGFKAPEAKGRVYFKNLKNGAGVPATFTVEFGVDGLRVRPAGEDPLDHTSGHHHLIIDGRPVPPGQLVPFDNKDLHFGKGQKEAQVTLPPGRHTLTLQFADGAHRSYGPRWSATITVNVT